MREIQHPSRPHFTFEELPIGCTFALARAPGAVEYLKTAPGRVKGAHRGGVRECAIDRLGIAESSIIWGPVMAPEDDPPSRDSAEVEVALVGRDSVNVCVQRVDGDPGEPEHRRATLSFTTTSFDFTLDGLDARGLRALARLLGGYAGRLETT